MNNVALLGCKDYSEKNVRKAVLKSLDLLGGIEKFVSPGQKVLLKPNMLAAAKVEEAVCTHPAVVKAVIEIVRAAGGIVTLGDSPATGSAEKVADKNGIAKVCMDMGVPLIDFNHPKEVLCPNGQVCKRFIIDKAVLEADIIISLPKLKTHGLTFFTGGVKNLYGCISGKEKAQFHLRMTDHEDFSKMLVDLYSVIKPTLTIMDGIIGMEGAGPRSGTPRDIGVILASTSAVALDAVATQVIGLNPLDIPTTKFALVRKVDIEQINDIRILGEQIDEFIIKDFRQSSAFKNFTLIPRPVVSFLQNRLVAKPIITDKCIGCGVCRDCCPPKVIKIDNKKAVISYDNCIRCYCCQELCPHNAIVLKRGRLGRLLFKQLKV